MLHLIIILTTGGWTGGTPFQTTVTDAYDC
jgi:hypothetical protein